MSAERRREAQIVVPGSPEEVWHAIATSSGHAAWIFPADIDETTVRIHREPFGPDVTANVTVSERPHRFAYEEPIDPALPPLATEIPGRGTRRRQLCCLRRERLRAGR